MPPWASYSSSPHPWAVVHPAFPNINVIVVGICSTVCFSNLPRSLETDVRRAQCLDKLRRFGGVQGQSPSRAGRP
ncbi:uncharacterized protein BDZ99DRAFT_465780 [Mytilinidion resinicola]|uniref:Uncharacterized protein n=1 Tax=Mytilinidion resinicola TaxID=574789 RepID=A0A6A6YEQ2_9PEZI|nr:uncharacterized protein BDZ99DRAFT_465780 [Mytilinidion resinicola]KAF2807048.1 hypothetical protein BDZ99DRAFT_465780 [Mytilinidion resinicola]